MAGAGRGESREGVGEGERGWRSYVKDHETVSSELSELISIHEFKEQMRQVHRMQIQEGLGGAGQADIQRVMCVTDDVIKMCADKCSVQDLLPTGGLAVIQHLRRKELPTNTGVDCIDNLVKVDNFSTTRHLLQPAPTSIPRSLPFSLTSLVVCPEVVLSVLVYHPIKRLPYAQYLVLSSQKLVEFRDKLYCPRDYAIEVDFSRNPDRFDRKAIPIPPTPSKSAFFFINNAFYNDLRYPESEDYSSIIIKWADDPTRLNKSSRLDAFTTGDMVNTRFEDLSLRLGYPYLFCHHGNCEHAIIFTDLRLFSSVDIQRKDCYPLLTHYWKDYRKRCCVCEEFTAVWTTLNDSLANETPAFFCNTCFKMLHYLSNGEKACEFEAYPYFDENTTLLESALPPIEQ